MTKQNLPLTDNAAPAETAAGASARFSLRRLSALLALRPRAVLLNILGSAILAFGLYNIHSLSGVTEGGILGMTLLLQHWLHLSPAVSGFIMNAACYLLGWRLLGHSFIAYSVIAGGSFSLFYAVCELFPPLMPWIAEMPLLAAVLGAMFVGVGAGLCVRAGGAPSGDDALAMSICKRFRWDIRWAYLLSDLIVLALSLTYLDLGRIALSLLTVVLSGQIIGIIQKIGRKQPQDAENNLQSAEISQNKLYNADASPCGSAADETGANVSDIVENSSEGEKNIFRAENGEISQTHPDPAENSADRLEKVLPAENRQQ